VSEEKNAGAAYWADEGGIVIELKNVPGYDVNAALEGRVRTVRGYEGNPKFGEQEIAVPGPIKPEQITRVGVVTKRANGIVEIKWIEKKP
jgi:hypothetical protein